MGASSPFFRSLPLDVDRIVPDISVAHPFDDGGAGAMMQSLNAAVAEFGKDGPKYARYVRPFVEHRDAFFAEILRSPHVPRHPVLLARFGLLGFPSAAAIAKTFRTEGAKTILAGTAAHGGVPLNLTLSSALGFVMLIAGHCGGWPIARGGSQRITDALANRLRALGGTIEAGRRIGSLRELPDARAFVFDVTPRQLLRIAGDDLASMYRSRLRRFQYGCGVFKIDYALSAPIPWRADACRRSPTVHVGGTSDQMIDAEARVGRGEHPERPFIILTQPSVLDDSRAPAGKHVAWAYTHVPNGSTVDMTERMERQIERFAPGFRDIVTARKASAPRDLENENANLVGGDIAGGMTDWKQLFARPIAKLDPYATPNKKIFLCSSSTPPGGGVHGMCGYWSAQSVLHHVFGMRPSVIWS